jgi:galactofuranosylgalactofuranosylrhamnosyl-N-acetylglucosaminyl-diphospho-decaprenol beta-1,5/1,6-galactofuranosyltransferase
VFKRMRNPIQESPSGLRLRWITLSTLLSHWFHAPRPENVAHPEVEFGKGDAFWWRLPKFDSALVSAADGSGKNIYTRDRAQFRKMLVDSVRLHRRLRRQWPKLAARYRAAAPELTSLSAWQRTFEESA